MSSWFILLDTYIFSVFLELTLSKVRESYCVLFSSEQFWLFDSNSECTTDRINIRIDANHSNVECFYEMHNLVLFCSVMVCFIGAGSLYNNGYCRGFSSQATEIRKTSMLLFNSRAQGCFQTPCSKAPNAVLGVACIFSWSILR